MNCEEAVNFIASSANGLKLLRSSSSLRYLANSQPREGEPGKVLPVGVSVRENVVDLSRNSTDVGLDRSPDRSVQCPDKHIAPPPRSFELPLLCPRASVINAVELRFSFFLVFKLRNDFN